jgi:formiminoglutamase
MDLKIFFDQIDEEQFSFISHPYALGNQIKFLSDKTSSWDEVDIAILGLTEVRGTEDNKGAENGANAIRKTFYNLKKGTGAYRIIDLGNLRCGLTLEDTYFRIREVCLFLLENNVVPMLIGGSNDLDYGQFLSYQSLDRLISVLSVDAFLDMDGEHQNLPSKFHNYKILLHEPNYLFNFSQLGYQTYLNKNDEPSSLEKLYFETFRLGLLREKLTELEPIIRNADMMSFDITAIKMNDAPGNGNAQVFGLTGEEACQICWYAGMNDKLSSIGFYEYNPELDERDKTAKVIGTMMWYFIEGFYNRKGEKDFKGNNYLKYVVSMSNQPESITFYKSRLSEKWWMEVPYPQNFSTSGKHFIVPCNYEDYLVACKGELPERWINTHAKLI